MTHAFRGDAAQSPTLEARPSVTAQNDGVTLIRISRIKNTGRNRSAENSRLSLNALELLRRHHLREIGCRPLHFDFDHLLLIEGEVWHIYPDISQWIDPAHHYNSSSSSLCESNAYCNDLFCH